MPHSGCAELPKLNTAKYSGLDEIYPKAVQEVPEAVNLWVISTTLGVILKNKGGSVETVGKQRTSLQKKNVINCTV